MGYSIYEGKRMISALKQIILVVVLILLYTGCQLENPTEVINEPVDGTTYRVIYHGNGNDFGDVPVDPNEYADRAMFKLLYASNLFKIDHVFLNWSISPTNANKTYNPGVNTIIKSTNMHFYANYRAGFAVWLYFEPNHFQSTGSMPHLVMWEGGLTNLPLCNFETPGYTFDGWAASPDGPVIYTNGSVIHMVNDAPHRVYAKWVLNQIYSITFDANGGTGYMPIQDMSDGMISNLSANEFINTGYVFAGWATTPGGTVAFRNCSVFTNGSNYTTLYAVWRDDYLASVVYKDLIDVQSGSFLQTDTDSNSFNHSLDAFKIGKYEITYELWHHVFEWASTNGYQFANSGREGSSGSIGASPTSRMHEPVTTINWRDSIVWCNAYSEIMGLQPCYSYNGDFIKDSRDVNSIACDSAVCDWSAKGYRLPTEGEWQFAASYIDGTSWTSATWASGATTSGSWDDVAWYSCSSTSNVGLKNPNALSIYDMSGNVWEWCWDWYGAWPGASDNYDGPITGEYRIGKGGSIFYSTSYLQIGDHNCYNLPSYETYHLGFRIVSRN
jgi:formylglycine-generating enzyme required for sulfatase activity